MDIQIKSRNMVYTITSNKHNFILRTTKIAKLDDGTVKQYKTDDRYYQNIENLLNVLLDVDLRLSDANSIAELTREVKDLRKIILPMTTNSHEYV